MIEHTFIVDFGRISSCSSNIWFVVLVRLMMSLTTVGW